MLPLSFQNFLLKRYWRERDYDALYAQMMLSKELKNTFLGKKRKEKEGERRRRKEGRGYSIDDFLSTANTANN